jgi:hypothetical protein
VQLSIFWLVIITMIMFRMEGGEERESKDIKERGKNK